MLRQAENKVHIEGILSEINLKYGSYVNNKGANVDNIGGNIKVLVRQEINGEDCSIEVPVFMFSPKYKNDGGLNPAYESIEKVMKEYVSIAACGVEDRADKIRITSGSLTMNEYFNKQKQLQSFPRIKASFVSKADANFHPEATFSVEMAISSIDYMTDNDGVELNPPKLRVKGIVPMYGGKINTMEFCAINPKAIDAINTYWEVGKTYSCKGRVNFSSSTIEITEECDFGEPDTTYRTQTISELIITKGTQAPYDDDMAFDKAELSEALKEHKAYLETLKDRSEKNYKAAPAPTGSNAGIDLGF